MNASPSQLACEGLISLRVEALPLVQGLAALSIHPPHGGWYLGPLDEPSDQQQTQSSGKGSRLCQQYRERTSVLENQPAGTFVLQVQAVDADEGSNGRREYVVTVTATDQATDPLIGICQLNILILDQNDNSPNASSTGSGLGAGEPAGRYFVLQVQAVDADEGSTAAAVVVSGGGGGFLLTFIPPRTKLSRGFAGAIVTARKFDRERQREYVVTVTATDQATDPLIGICQLNILILDQNDNSPKFENLRYEYFLREDTMIGTSFLRVAAHDDDFGTNAAVAYSMSDEQPEYLRVNPLTGWVFVNQPISQTIKATSPLGDPRVTYNLEEGLVPETNMPVRFYLTPNREDGSASILVAEPLDYETTRNFMLRVRAQNVAAVPLAAFTVVHINPQDSKSAVVTLLSISGRN
ncbi:hypothetical protein CRUP_021089 [Coryphaenoides rupestris]|nr:hypothetical protein CRUP_021089 [Coryphaenoides rupestris]